MSFRKKRINYKLFGEVLVDLNVIGDNQLDQALKIQKEQKPTSLIGEILMEMGALNDEDIAGVFNRQYAFPFLHVESVNIDSELINLIPHDIVRKHSLIPVSRMGHCVSIAMSNPLNTEAIKEVESRCQCKVHVLLATSSALIRVINKYYPAQPCEDEGPDYVSEIENVLAAIEEDEKKSEHQATVQRRIHERVPVKDQIFLALEKDSRKPIKLYDISMTGVSGLLDRQLSIGEVVDIDWLYQPFLTKMTKQFTDNAWAAQDDADNSKQTAVLLNSLFERSSKKQARVAWCHQTSDNMWKVGLDFTSAQRLEAPQDERARSSDTPPEEA